MAVVDPLDRIAVPRRLIIDFFAVFARCEYAMKEAGYRRDERGMAAPAWQRLADDAAVWLKVELGSALARAIELLTTAPPQLQTFADGWQTRPLRGATELAQAIDAATRVRHNLFHGGKHATEAVAGRDTELVHAASVLLVALIEQGPDALKRAYNHD